MSAYSEPTSFTTYLPVSSRDREWQIFCTCMGASVITPGASYPLHPHQHPDHYIHSWTNPGRGRILDEFQLLYITKGRGTLVSGGKLHRIEEGSVLILFPGIPHWYCPDLDTGWNEYWVGFKGEYPEILTSHRFLSPRTPVCKIGISDIVVDHFHRMREISMERFPGFQYLCGAHVLLLLAEITSMKERQEKPDEAELLISRARILFEENLHSTLDMEEIIEALGSDYVHIRDAFKRSTGLSPYHYFLEMKINKAKQLLSERGSSVKEVAYTLSFENPYYFSRIFKKKTGISPSNWKVRNGVL